MLVLSTKFDVIKLRYSSTVAIVVYNMLLDLAHIAAADCAVLLGGKISYAVASCIIAEYMIAIKLVNELDINHS